MLKGLSHLIALNHRKVYSNYIVNKNRSTEVNMEERPKRMRFSVGEFAKLTGVPKQTLQFYDKMGIFEPAIRLDNGYRYYEAEQYEAIDIIYALKEAGLPLSDIKHYLDHRTPEMCVALLDKEAKRIKEKIRALEKTLITVEQKKASTVKGMHIMAGEPVQLITLPEAHLFTWDFSQIDDANFMLELIRMVNWCYDHGYYTGYAMGSIVEESALKENHFSKISYMFTVIDHAVDHPNYRYRPAGVYAVYHYKGHYEGLPTVYPLIKEAIEKSGHFIAGDSYESGLHDFFSVRDAGDYLVEIAVPVVLNDN